jgi:dihydroneopterin aldolase
MKFYGYHGVLPEEQENGQDFYIDVEMSLDLKKPGKTDELSDTVNYAEVYGIIKYVTKSYKFRLIEKLAERISREILSSYDKIYEIMVRVKKPEAPLTGEFDMVGVEVRRKREEL